MIFWRFRAAFAIGLIAALSACSGSDIDTNSNKVGVEPQGAAEFLGEPADQAWQQLVDNDQVPQQALNESAAQYFSRRVEESNQRRRRFGLQFWTDHPHDPRRYSWLLKTIHMPPVYPQSMEEWSAAEQSPWEINKADRDEEARSEWDDQYQSMRAAFLGSDAVTDEQKRYLIYGELKAQIHELEYRLARNELADVEGFLERYLDFVRTFPEPFDDTTAIQGETSAHRTIMRTLLWMVFDEYRHAFDWRLDEALAFLEALETASPNSRASQLATRVEALGSLPPRGSLGLLPQGDLTEDQKPWRWTVRHSQENISASTSEEGRFVDAYHFINEQIRSRDVGFVLWERYPNVDEQFRWLQGLQSVDFPIYHVTSIDKALLAVVEGRVSDIPVQADVAASLRERLAGLRTELLDSDIITSEQRASLLSANIAEAGVRIRELGPNIFNLAEMVAFREQLIELIIEQGPSREATRVLEDMVDYPRRYRFTEVEFATFMDRLRAVDANEVRALVAEYDTRQGMKSVPISFEMPEFGLNEVIDIETYRGKLVYLDPWATWCVPCIQAMPGLQEVYSDFKDDGFVLLSMPNDAIRNPNGVNRVIDSYDLTFKVGIADDLHGKRPELNAYILLGRDGRVLRFHDRTHGPNLRSILEEVLAAEQDAIE